MAIQKGEKLRPMAGGLARAEHLTAEQRSAIATKAVAERWRLYHLRKPKAQKAGSNILPIKPAKL